MSVLFRSRRTQSGARRPLFRLLSLPSNGHLPLSSSNHRLRQLHLSGPTHLLSSLQDAPSFLLLTPTTPTRTPILLLLHSPTSTSTSSPPSQISYNLITAPSSSSSFSTQSSFPCSPSGTLQILVEQEQKATPSPPVLRFHHPPTHPALHRTSSRRSSRVE